MGLPLFSGSDLHERSYAIPPPRPGNPVPSRFGIKRAEQYGNHVVAEVWYPDAHNYEGRKILVYLNEPTSRVRGAKLLDPHFAKPDPKQITPFARFEPTEAGWDAAVFLARALP